MADDNEGWKTAPRCIALPVFFFLQVSLKNSESSCLIIIWRARPSIFLIWTEIMRLAPPPLYMRLFTIIKSCNCDSSNAAEAKNVNKYARLIFFIILCLLHENVSTRSSKEMDWEEWNAAGWVIDAHCFKSDWPWWPPAEFLLALQVSHLYV